MNTKEDTDTPSSELAAEGNKVQIYNYEKQNGKKVSFYTIIIYIWLIGVILLSVATILN
ncbi:bla regulator protein blaR1 [Bacillus sp. ok061]|nr:bla regulator protein blaR1 [Bacillus sp. ok061]